MSIPKHNLTLDCSQFSENSAGWSSCLMWIFVLSAMENNGWASSLETRNTPIIKDDW